MIDIHCHILPNTDDGARNQDIALKMLHIAKEDGIDSIIVTPHYNEVYYDTEHLAIIDKVNKLNAFAKEQGIDIKLIKGQEINVRTPLLRMFKEGKLSSLGDSNYYLLELAVDRLTREDIESIYELRLLGAVPVVAHIERYPYIIKKPQLINELIKEGCLFQLNAGSLLGVFGKEVKATTEIFIKNNVYDFVGSDAHGTSSRSPKLKKAYETLTIAHKDMATTLKDNVEGLLKNSLIRSKADLIPAKRSILDLFYKKQS